MQSRLVQSVDAGQARLLTALLGLSVVLLILGWILPIMSIETLVILTERVSILETCLQLAEEGEVFLFLIVTVFSVVFPVMKLLVAFYLWYLADLQRPGFSRTLYWIEALGKWSMLDVFVAALIVVAVKTSLISEVEIHPGIYLFSAAVILSLLVVSRISKLARAASGKAALAV